MLSGDQISPFKCYLTGDHNDSGGFHIAEYLITGKHNFSRYVYNPKDNIYRENADPIYRGIPTSELSDFGGGSTSK